MLIQTVEYKDFEKFKAAFTCTFDPKYIFRGQANGYSSKTDTWDLNSSFKRYFSKKELTFRSFIVNNLERNRFDRYFSNYKYPNSKQIAKAPFIEKLYYLQHYGVPTCLIDFTKNPLVAIYFALTQLKIPAVKQFSQNTYISLGENRFVTVYQIDTQQLLDVFKFKDIDDRNFCWDYDQFVLPYSTQIGIKIALDLNPLSKIKFLDNYNLMNQNGCFILFDNTESSDSVPFDETLQIINDCHLKRKFERPVIIKHNLYLDYLRTKDAHESIFSFIFEEKRISGRTLFNDIQGLKYDLLQIQDRS